MGRSAELDESRDLGGHIRTARLNAGLSQMELAARCGLTQGAISSIEQGRRLPSLGQFFSIARSLEVPLQKMLNGKDQPGDQLPDIAFQLRSMGVVDLWVRGASIPGAYRRPEEIIAIAARGDEPEPRIITALPSVLAWNEWDGALLSVLCRRSEPRRRMIYRLAWLADIALAIDRRRGFPGGCDRPRLKKFVLRIPRPRVSDWDGLGRPMRENPASPLWRRWKVSFDADLLEFEQRAEQLAIMKKTGVQAATPGAGHDSG